MTLKETRPLFISVSGHGVWRTRRRVCHTMIVNYPKSKYYLLFMYKSILFRCSFDTSLKVIIFFIINIDGSDPYLDDRRHPKKRGPLVKFRKTHCNILLSVTQTIITNWGSKLGWEVMSQDITTPTLRHFGL